MALDPQPPRVSGRHLRNQPAQHVCNDCQAILAFAKGDYDQAVELLLPVRSDWACLGGSHAQRDIFSQFLIEAALAAKRFPLARSLLAERLALKPHSAGSWLKYAEALTALDDLAGAARARRESQGVVAA